MHPKANPPPSTPAEAERNSTKRFAPPASPGLPPSRRTRLDRTERRQRDHPAPSGRPKLLKTEQIIDETLARMDTDTPLEIATALNIGAQAKPVKAVISAARELLARKAEDYVALHFEAAQIAASEGDAKPAQWALERIAEGEVRIVDAPKQASLAQPAVQIGIAVGGVPQSQPSVKFLTELQDVTLPEPEPEPGIDMP